MKSRNLILNEIKGAVIIYCNTRNNVSQLTNLLKAYKYKVEEYHAGLTIETRQRNQRAWMNDEIQIMVWTSAFGMGIRYLHHRVYECFAMVPQLENRKMDFRSLQASF